MDPYLERPGLWHGVHNRLIAALADLLGPLLRPRYFVAVEERSYLADPLAIGLTAVPDVGVLGPYAAPTPAVQVSGARTATVEPLLIELPMPEPVRETYLEIQEVAGEPNAGLWMKSTDGDINVVTLVEILSPWNKSSREGRVQYQRKRLEVLNSHTNLVEIDLLRTGQRSVQTQHDAHYSILVSPALLRPRAQFYPFTVRETIPAFQLPLQDNDDWPLIDLNTLLHDLYDRGAYDLRIDYRSEPTPPFNDADAGWVANLLHAAHLR
jgi:hypothetical protein